MAAGLVAMTARSSGRLEGRDEVIEESDRLRHDATRLADDDREAYTAVLEALPRRDEQPATFQRAVQAANQPPMGITEAGLRVASLGERMLRTGNPALHGEAVTAVLLASAAIASATRLVELNTGLADLPADDLRAARSRRDEGAALAALVVGSR